jgi:hypothetical protein
MMITEVSPMEDALTQPPPLKTRADYEAATQRCLDEMDRMQASIADDFAEIERLKRETREILAKIRSM